MDQAEIIIKSALHNLCASIVITDSDGLTIYVSPSFTQTTGYTLSDMIGKTPGAVLQGALTETDVVDQIRHSIEAREKISTTITNYRKDGSIINFMISIQPCFDSSSSSLIGFLGIQQDITTTVMQYQEKNKLALELINEIKEKNDLMSLFKHDIRNSVSYIKFIGQIKGIAEIADAVDSCLTTIEQDKYSGQSSCPLKYLIRDVIQDTHYISKPKKITMHISNISDAVSWDIKCMYLFIAIRNFVVNAIKFSPESSTISIGMKDSDRCIYIKDQGTGINNEKIIHLLTDKLDDIKTIGAGQSAHINGSQSGFIISRQLLETQGCTIKIQSSIGEGTTVLIYNPGSDFDSELATTNVVSNISSL